MTRTFNRMTSTRPPSPLWSYRSARINFLDGYERSLQRRAASVARRAERLRRSATVVPVTQRRLGPEMDVPDARTHHVDLPTGARMLVHELAGPPGAPILILLHGWRGTAAGNWATVMPSLAADFRVIAPDLRGHDPGSVDDVVGLADALGVERFIAVGYSLGSAVAAQLARRHPDRVQAMVLCAAAGVSTRSGATTAEPEIPTAVVITRQDRLIPAWRQLELARSLPGASVHPVDGNHFAFSRRDVFAPVLLAACRSVVRRTDAEHRTLEV